MKICEIAKSYSAGTVMIFMFLAYAAGFLAYIISIQGKSKTTDNLDLFKTWNYFLPSKVGWFARYTQCWAILLVWVVLVIENC